MRLLSGAFFVLLNLNTFSVISQTITSPYSYYGLGEMNDIALPHNEAMGNLGVGINHNYNINLINPAWLTYNHLSSFNVGIKGERRNFNSDISKGSDGTASIGYMVFAVPFIANKWGTAFSLLPFSSVNYYVTSNGVVNNAQNSETVQNVFEGSGGLSQLAMSSGYRVFGQMNLGARVTYVFGSIERNVKNIIDSSAVTNYFTEYVGSDSYSDIILGLSYGQKVKLSETRYLNLGMTYDFPGSLKGTRDIKLNRLASDGVTLITETDVTSDQPIHFDLPTKIGIGISYEVMNKLKLGTDVKLARWVGTTNTTNAVMRNTFGVNLGGEYIHDYRDVNSYLNRIIFRAGVSYGQMPYVIKETDINEFGINFGASFPTNGISSIDTGFRFGVRGTTENDLIQETFFQFIFGMSINDRWFIKRRYD